MNRETWRRLSLSVLAFSKCVGSIRGMDLNNASWCGSAHKRYCASIFDALLAVMKIQVLVVSARNDGVGLPPSTGTLITGSDAPFPWMNESYSSVPHWRHCTWSWVPWKNVLTSWTIPYQPNSLKEQQAWRDGSFVIGFVKVHPWSCSAPYARSPIDQLVFHFLAWAASLPIFQRSWLSVTFIS